MFNSVPQNNDTVLLIFILFRVEQNNNFVALEDTPFDSVASEIKDFLSVKNDGEYLINVLDDDADIIRIKEFVEG